LFFSSSTLPIFFLFLFQICVFTTPPHKSIDPLPCLFCISLSLLVSDSKGRCEIKGMVLVWKEAVLGKEKGSRKKRGK